MSASPDKPLLLLVDDLPGNLHVLVASLKADYRIRTATSGVAALELAAMAERPDLILLDVIMPGMNGIEVLRRLREQESTRRIPVILVTAESSAEGEHEGLALGADDYLTKPIVVPVMQARISNILQREALSRKMLALQAEQGDRELRAAQEQLQIARTQLENSSKLESLGRLVAAFAHDIASPIGNSRMAAGTALAALNDLRAAVDQGKVSRSLLDRELGTAREGTSLVLANTDRAIDLLNSFKQLALDQATSQQREIDLDVWLHQFVYTLSPMFKKTAHRVEVQASPGLRLNTQPGPLGQVLTNLVNNALLHAFEHKESGTLLISSALGEDGRIELQLSDDGCGMSPQVLARAFEPFFTTKANRGGTGLGLDIVKHLVENVLGGELQVHSEVGTGTRFQLRFPKLSAAAGVASQN